ncbi:hypothetical protein [Stigmatella aurantiaca]|nr:hypothetical protein [Stigmatella aurantiaca]ADO76049.1 conserved uncharacterized protein [Stigmatella aurantiaca DW4/3-1]
MAIAIRIQFKTPGRDDLHIPVAAQGAYHTVWLPASERLSLKWVPLFENGPTLDVKEMVEVMDELQKLRAMLAGDSKNAWLLERIEFILDELSEVDWDEVSEIFVG